MQDHEGDPPDADDVRTLLFGVEHGGLFVSMDGIHIFVHHCPVHFDSKPGWIFRELSKRLALC